MDADAFPHLRNSTITRAVPAYGRVEDMQEVISHLNCPVLLFGAMESGS